MKTYSPKPQHIQRQWYVVDAQGQTLGRMASQVAVLLRGKHKPIYAPHMDTGDHVIVINAGGVVLTGGKETSKVAYRHSGYPGGIKGVGYDRLMKDRPVFVVEKAVRGMLPKNRLGRAMIKKLHVVEGAEHPHQAQQPVPYTLGRPPVWEGLPEPAPKRIPRSATRKSPPKQSTAAPTESTATAGGSTAAAKKGAAPEKGAAVKRKSAAKRAPKAGTDPAPAAAEGEDA